MPYTICVNQPGYLPEADPYAVATFEDAREAVDAELSRSNVEGLMDFAALNAEVAALPESGGTIGPLPDGYVIDVTEHSYDSIAAQARALAEQLEGKA
jgi:hypothetical protein